MDTNPRLKSLAHYNLNSTVYSTLRQALLSGDFRPNAKLRIRELADQLGTSVTPVRDAILLLAKEQALVLRSPKDIRVPLLTRDQYLEICAIRVELEGLAAQKAAEVITVKQLKDLELLIKRNMAALKEKQMLEASRLNQAFHFQLAEIADTPILKSIIDRLWMQTAPLIAMAYTSSYTDDIRISHHHEAVDALRKRDGARAREAIREDIIGGSQKILDLIENFPDSDD